MTNDWNKARTLLKEIAVRHRQAWNENNSKGMALAEEEAIIVCDAYAYPSNNPNLLLASFWPD